MDDSIQSARHYLATHNVLCLSTCVDSTSWVAPVFYAVCNSRLVFLSAPHTAHCKNIVSNPHISASIQQDYKEWTEIKGIQLEGAVSRVKSADTPSVIQAYSKKFPLTGEDAPPEIARALDKIHWFEIKVQRLLFIDNSKGLGHRVEVEPEQLFLP